MGIEIFKCSNNMNSNKVVGSSLYCYFQASLCILRRITGNDSAYHAIPAGLFAGIAFRKYPDTTVALYVLWKAAQVLSSKFSR